MNIQKNQPTNLAALSKRWKISTDALEKRIEEIKNKIIARNILKTYGDQKIICCSSEKDIEIAKFIINANMGFEALSKQKIKDHILSLHYSMNISAIKSSDKINDWDYIVPMFYIALSQKDARDLHTAVLIFIRGDYGKWMPKPSELAEKCNLEKVKRENIVSYLSSTLKIDKKQSENIDYHKKIDTIKSHKGRLLLEQYAKRAKNRNIK